MTATDETTQADAAAAVSRVEALCDKRERESPAAFRLCFGGGLMPVTVTTDSVRAALSGGAGEHDSTPLPAELGALAAEVAKLRAALGEIRALADRWEAQQYHSGAYYPEAVSHDEGRDHQAQACADDIRAVLDRHGVTAQPDTRRAAMAGDVTVADLSAEDVLSAIHKALEVRDMAAVAILLHVLVVKDPGSAALFLDTIRLGVTS